MFLTGFADEAANSIDGQIKATKALGWSHIEARNIDGRSIHDISDDKFEDVFDKLGEAGIHVNCIGSAIANWATRITDPFEKDMAKVERAVPRMKRLGCKMIRIMSYPPLHHRAPDDQMEEERFTRLRWIVDTFAADGIVAGHENCDNYGGMSWRHTLKMLDHVPGLKLIFDTGNPCFTRDFSRPEPRPWQNAWEFYNMVQDHVVYIHIKDSVNDLRTQKNTFTHAGDGNGHVRAIVRHVMEKGYDHGFSMEPHLAVVVHDSSVAASDEVRYANYVEYGQRFMELLKTMGYGDRL